MKYKNKLIFFYPSIETGGLTKNLFSLINSLSKKNYKISFITYRHLENNVAKKLYSFNKKIDVITPRFSFKTNRRYPQYFFCFFTLLNFCIKNSYLIISFQSNILAIIIAKLTNRKIIIRCNTAPSKYISNYIKKFFFKFFYSLSDKILVTSGDFKKEIKKYFNLNSIIHRQSLDLIGIKRKSKIKLNFNFFKGYKYLKIINVGRLTEQKDLITLLEAFSKLIKVRKARLLFIGNGSDYKKLKLYINNKKINKHVKIIDFQSNPYKFISLADVKVLTSKYEGNPNILLEIAGLKKPIISTNCKVGPGEILQGGKGGILFRVGDHQRLYSILKDLKISHRKIKAKVNMAYNYVKKNFKKDISEPFIEIIKNY
jgi:glycosyltransferase involved in cell wall biosynthesis